MNKAKANLTKVLANPIQTAVLILIGFTTLVVGFTIGYAFHRDKAPYDSEFIESVLVEAHGMLMDILVIGVIILWLDKIRERQFEIRGYQEEIDDFRGWNSDEAAHRIRGNILRLNRKGISKISLFHCNLAKVNLQQANLQGAELWSANLEESNLQRTNFQKANLHKANLRGATLYMGNLHKAILRGANLQGADLEEANLQETDFGPVSLLDDEYYDATLRDPDYFREADLGEVAYWNGLEAANLKKANLKKANLEGAKLQWANLQEANLNGANLQRAYLYRTDLRGANLQGVLGLSLEQLSEVKTLYEAKLDIILMEQVQETYPLLFEKPKIDE